MHGQKNILSFSLIVRVLNLSFSTVAYKCVTYKCVAYKCVAYKRNRVV